jgi:hypothetical protein
MVIYCWLYVLTLGCKHAEPAIYAIGFWHKLLFRRSALFHPSESKLKLLSGKDKGSGKILTLCLEIAWC